MDKTMKINKLKFTINSMTDDEILNIIKSKDIYNRLTGIGDFKLYRFYDHKTKIPYFYRTIAYVGDPNTKYIKFFDKILKRNNVHYKNTLCKCMVGYDVDKDIVIITILSPDSPIKYIIDLNVFQSSYYTNKDFAKLNDKFNANIGLDYNIIDLNSSDFYEKVNEVISNFYKIYPLYELQQSCYLDNNYIRCFGVIAKGKDANGEFIDRISNCIIEVDNTFKVLYRDFLKPIPLRTYVETKLRNNTLNLYKLSKDVDINIIPVSNVYNESSVIKYYDDFIPKISMYHMEIPISSIKNISIESNKLIKE